MLKTHGGSIATVGEKVALRESATGLSVGLAMGRPLSMKDLDAVAAVGGGLAVLTCRWGEGHPAKVRGTQRGQMINGALRASSRLGAIPRGCRDSGGDRLFAHIGQDSKRFIKAPCGGMGQERGYGRLESKNSSSVTHDSMEHSTTLCQVIRSGPSHDPTSAFYARMANGVLRRPSQGQPRTGSTRFARACRNDLRRLRHPSGAWPAVPYAWC